MFALLPQINVFVVGVGWQPWRKNRENTEKYIKETIKLKQKALFFRKFDYGRLRGGAGKLTTSFRVRKGKSGEKFLLIKVKTLMLTPSRIKHISVLRNGIYFQGKFLFSP